MKDFSESPPLFLTARQLAGRLGLSVGQIRALAKEGRIPEITVGKNTRRYDLDAVVAALTHRDGSDKPRTLKFCNCPAIPTLYSSLVHR